MATIPARIASRFSSSIKRFQSVLSAAKSRDVNESDTVIIVTDMLSEVFGYDKYSEITSEHAIRGSYCDLATLLDGRVELLVEAKAIGIELKDSHVKQAVDYAANKGIDWVVLTNGTNWRVYNVIFGKPIDQDLVYEIDFLSFDAKSDESLELVYVLSKEGWVKQVLSELHQQKQILNRFVIAGVARSESVLDAMRKELRRIYPDVKLQNDQIEAVLTGEVLKREVVEGEKAEEARKKITRARNRYERARGDRAADALPATDDEGIQPPTPVEAAVPGAILTQACVQTTLPQASQTGPAV